MKTYSNSKDAFEAFKRDLERRSKAKKEKIEDVDSETYWNEEEVSEHDSYYNNKDFYDYGL